MTVLIIYLAIALAASGALLGLAVLRARRQRRMTIVRERRRRGSKPAA